jgi:hypothetical protein
MSNDPNERGQEREVGTNLVRTGSPTRREGCWEWITAGLCSNTAPEPYRS